LSSLQTKATSDLSWEGRAISATAVELRSCDLSSDLRRQCLVLRVDGVSPIDIGLVGSDGHCLRYHDPDCDICENGLIEAIGVVKDWQFVVTKRAIVPAITKIAVFS
jgi:hypothetical protein